MAVARCRIDLVPPAQPDQPPAGNILEVVEVAGEEEDGDDEDQDEVGGKEEAEKVDKEGGCRRRCSVSAGPKQTSAGW